MKEIDVELIERYGYVIQANGTITKGNKPIGSSPNTSGYLKVMLCVANKRSMYLVHRLVATKYLKPVAGKFYVNHKDKNKLNCAADNLEWCTHAENMQHAHGITNRKDEAKELASSGMKYKEIAIRLGVSAATIGNWVNDRDIALQKRTQRAIARDEGRLSYSGSQTTIKRS